ncbi:hypothetical protein ASPZODRAFT_1613926 [Penicilliopsis zonata CBS 506.65]|uniref:Uncharacterized protein n=1 Tax=Penicilliopsis zonata CBS 506.65 TaxID=1073090 RepID=A0A1L9SN22_9EURO|nr:hypothetical protein ASPZODRAFT_1613926 [Penicilliopsis zonata CBS 506.65]OJJ48516.1 hypothetical protein ASPZODRAFT_1613926 [Penicilliopsis zonata CBS 506.65]
MDSRPGRRRRRHTQGEAALKDSQNQKLTNHQRPSARKHRHRPQSTSALERVERLELDEERQTQSRATVKASSRESSISRDRIRGKESSVPVSLF